MSSIRLTVLVLALSAASYGHPCFGQPFIYGGDNQISSVDYLQFPEPLQVWTGACIDKPCTQYSVTFTSPDSRLAFFCPSSPCVPTTSMTVQNPTDSQIASVPLYVGTLAGGYLVTAACRGTTLYFHEGNVAGQPEQVSATGGTPQAVLPSSPFSPLQATVIDHFGNTNPGVQVTFDAPPPGGATAFFPGPASSATAFTNASGVATSPDPTASAVPGSFTATASVAGLSSSASFALTILAQVTVGTDPAGRTFTVDGAAYSGTHVFNWAPGSRHTIATTSPQAGAAGTRYVWTNWSDSGAISHGIAASAGSVFTANFATQHLLTTAASPPGGGTVGPASGYYNASQTVGLSATAAPGYSFAGWTGTGPGSYTGSNAAGTVTMNGPVTEIATFTHDCVPLSGVTIGATGATVLCAGTTGGTATVTDTDGGPPTHQWGYRTVSGGSIVSIPGQTGTSYLIAAADFGGTGTYYLVCTTAPTCGSPTTSNELAIVIPPHPAITSVVPTDASTGFTAGSVSWTATDATKYDVLLDTVTPPQKMLVQGTASTTAATPTWFSSTPYSWQVVAHGTCGTTISPVFRFTTGACAFTGGAPTLLAPADASSNQPIATTLSWVSLPGTAHYDVYLGTTNPPTVRYRAVSDPATSLPVHLAPGTTYYWQVKAVPVCGNGAPAASAVRSLTTATSTLALASVTPLFLNRWTGGALGVLGFGFLATTTPFTDLDGHPAGAYTLGPWTATQVDGTVAADATAPAGRYDVGVTETGTELGRLPDALVLRAFTDVNETLFFFESSSRVVDAGLMEADFDAGTAGPQFVPTTVVTRALMAEYLAKAHQWIRTRGTALPAATCTPSGGGSADFPDVPCSHPDWLAIHWIKTWGITAGANCVPGPGICYLPDTTITRGQMVTFLSRLKYGPEGTGTVLQGFLDGFGANDPGCAVAYPACSGWTDAGLQVPPATWPHSYVNVAYQDRLTNGCSGTVPPFGFCTGSLITRGQMAEFLGRTVGLVPTP